MKGGQQTSLTKEVKIMANIKNLQMWNTICVDARISISKSLFGLHTTATYNPTNSVIDAKSFEYSPADGERLKRLLNIPYEKLAAAIGYVPPSIVGTARVVGVAGKREQASLILVGNERSICL